ncbi:hypothetical protein EMCRGX_G010702 [Ephydatia muelleri]
MQESCTRLYVCQPNYSDACLRCPLLRWDQLMMHDVFSLREIERKHTRIENSIQSGKHLVIDSTKQCYQMLFVYM